LQFGGEPTVCNLALVNEPVDPPRFGLFIGVFIGLHWHFIYFHLSLHFVLVLHSHPIDRTILTFDTPTKADSFSKKRSSTNTITMKSATLLALLFATTGLAAIPGMFEEEQAPHQVMNAMRKRDDDAQIKKFDNPEDGLCCCTDLKATYCVRIM
jgi:hypothetical protein